MRAWLESENVCVCVCVCSVWVCLLATCIFVVHMFDFLWKEKGKQGVRVPSPSVSYCNMLPHVDGENPTRCGSSRPYLATYLTHIDAMCQTASLFVWVFVPAGVFISLITKRYPSDGGTSFRN